MLPVMKNTILFVLIRSNVCYLHRTDVSLLHPFHSSQSKCHSTGRL